MTDPAQAFEHASSFEQGELSGNVHLGKFEAHYEELFAEVIEDGIITSEERARLDKAADSLGLDRGRLQRLEQALQAAYEARHQVKIRDLSASEGPASIQLPLGADDPRPSLRLPQAPATDPAALALQRRVAFLEARVAELEAALAEARAQQAVEVDLSDVAPAAALPDEDPDDLLRRVRRDPHDAGALRSLYRIWQGRDDADRRYCTAQALVFRGAASDEQRAYFEQRRPQGPIQPARSLTPEAWRRLLFHPDEEVLTGDIFSVIVSAVLLGRVSALRRDKALPHLDAATRQDPQRSTLQAVRCFAWAAATLGMAAPGLHVEPSFAGVVELVPGIPPVSRLGKLALSGRTSTELAFLAGRHLSWYREEHLVRMLVPSIPDLEELFLAALSIGNPAIPLGAEMKRRVTPLARAIEPILEPGQLDRLRGQFLRFVEEGGRTNLQRWATAANFTATRAGFLLAGDLEPARAMLALEDRAQAEAHLDDLIVFLASDRATNLRRQLGVAVKA
jgi:hypothetical protein